MKPTKTVGFDSQLPKIILCLLSVFTFIVCVNKNAMKYTIDTTTFRLLIRYYARSMHLCCSYQNISSYLKGQSNNLIKITWKRLIKLEVKDFLPVHPQLDEEIQVQSNNLSSSLIHLWWPLCSGICEFSCSSYTIGWNSF